MNEHVNDFELHARVKSLGMKAAQSLSIIIWQIGKIIVNYRRADNRVRFAIVGEKC